MRTTSHAEVDDIVDVPRMAVPTLGVEGAAGPPVLEGMVEQGAWLAYLSDVAGPFRAWRFWKVPVPYSGEQTPECHYYCGVR